MKKHLLFLSLLLIGCGSFEKYKNSKSSKSETNTETSKGNETKTTSFKDLFSYEPYDNTKPMIIGRDTIINTKIINNRETVFTHSKDTVYIREGKKEDVAESAKHKESDNTKLFAIIGLGIIGAMFFFFLIVIFGMMWYFKSMLTKNPL